MLLEEQRQKRETGEDRKRLMTALCSKGQEKEALISVCTVKLQQLLRVTAAS